MNADQSLSDQKVSSILLQSASSVKYSMTATVCSRTQEELCMA
jgi:hypothetical protein